ncbi:hypothetical protein BB368_20515 [Salmonella enterica subsp. enterica serovar Brandenburg]|nr:hypothetical protein [Salmonella enterica subsp. enterica serovar Brandenburg]
MLLLGGDDACTHLVIRFCFRYSLNSAQRKEHLWLTSREKAHGRESNSTNTLTCCALRFVELTATLVPVYASHP